MVVVHFSSKVEKERIQMIEEGVFRVRDDGVMHLSSNTCRSELERLKLIVAYLSSQLEEMEEKLEAEIRYLNFVFDQFMEMKNKIEGREKEVQEEHNRLLDTEKKKYQKLIEQINQMKHDC